MDRLNLVGQHFGRLTVLRFAGIANVGHSQWACVCDCGTEKVVASNNLKMKTTQSCGCLSEESHYKHGHSRVGSISGTYHSWSQMIQRCTNPKAKDYRCYGGRGISVCQKWLNFANFLSDMGNRPP